MNQKALQFIRNVCYAMGANVSRILTTFCLMLLLPRLLSVEDYSYWQLTAFMEFICHILRSAGVRELT